MVCMILFQTLVSAQTHQLSTVPETSDSSFSVRTLGTCDHHWTKHIIQSRDTCETVNTINAPVDTETDATTNTMVNGDRDEVNL